VTRRFGVASNPPVEVLTSIERGLQAFNLAHSDEEAVCDYDDSGYETFGWVEAEPAGHSLSDLKGISLGFE
jgi:hypothetical protein